MASKDTIISKSYIIPLCVYKTHDSKLSSVRNPAITSEGELFCTEKYHNYELSFTVYVVNPMFWPIPLGMKLYCFRRKQGHPYNTTEFLRLYNPFNLNDDHVYFIAYNSQVPNTIPLYIYEKHSQIYVTLSDIVPDDTWKEHSLSPIYVFDRPHKKFTCINGKSIPWSSSLKKEHIYGLDTNNISEFGENVFLCSEIHDIENIRKDKTNMIYSAHKLKTDKFMNIWVYLSIVFILIFAITIFIYDKYGLERRRSYS